MALRKQCHFYLFAKRAIFLMERVKKKQTSQSVPGGERVLPEPHPNWSPSGINTDIDTLFYVVHMLNHAAIL